MEEKETGKYSLLPKSEHILKFIWDCVNNTDVATLSKVLSDLEFKVSETEKDQKENENEN
jgi:hypothetical protein